MITFLALVASSLLAASAPSSDAPASDPAAAAIPTAADLRASTSLADLLAKSREAATSGLCIVMGEETLAEVRGDGAAELVSIQSITKSVVSLAVGKLIGDGKIATVDDPVEKYIPAFTGGKRGKVTIRHVLAHTTGIAAGDNFGLDVENSSDFLKHAIEAGFDAEPGEKFAYNNAAIQLARGVIEKASGLPMDEYVRRSILEPLGISRTEWGKDDSGGAMAHAALKMTARDLAKIGQLVLRRGEWRGARIIADSWFDTATPAVSDDTAGLWWNIVSDDASEAITDRGVIDRYEQAGLDRSIVERLRGMPDRARVGDYFDEYLSKFTRDEMAKIRDLRASIGARPFFRQRTIAGGFYSTGGGGQYLVINTKAGIVGARLIEPERVKDETTAFAAFLPGVLNLTEAPEE